MGGSLRPIPRFLRMVALLDLVLFLAVGLVGWAAGWRTSQYGKGLVVAGAIALFLGLASVGGSHRPVGVPLIEDHLWAMPSKGDDMTARVKRRVHDINMSYGFMTTMLVVGVVAIAVGALVDGVFG